MLKGGLLRFLCPRMGLGTNRRPERGSGMVEEWLESVLNSSTALDEPQYSGVARSATLLTAVKLYSC